MIDAEKLLGKISENLKPQQQVTFSIPADHPAADKLRKLMAHLQTAVVTPSGLHLQHRENDPSAVSEMLDALHRVLLEDGVEVPELDALVRQQKIKPLAMPQLFQTMIQVLGSLRS